MTADLEKLAGEIKGLVEESQLGCGPWEFSPATRGYITTIFARTLNGTPWDVGSANCGEPDMQNQHAELICMLVNNAPAIAAALREVSALREALEPFAAVAIQAEQGWTSGNYYKHDDMIRPAIRLAHFIRARVLTSTRHDDGQQDAGQP